MKKIDGLCCQIVDLTYPKQNTLFNIGNMCFTTEKKFNWFNRLMMRLVFGWKVERIKNDN